MSVSDPLIKDIKGCALKLFNEFQTHKKITDSSESLHDFCKVAETIFHQGLIEYQNSFYASKKIDVYTWMLSVAVARDDYIYKNCVEAVHNCKGVCTPLGKFRLLVRHCLAKKCLHVPLDSLSVLKKTGIFYSKNSIIGDEILAAILLSVLLQCGKINFQLQLDNFSFLDATWQLPDVVKLEVVPCNNLGISISFSDNKAVIVHIKPNSVISEFGEISVGDVLINLNNIEINSSCKGRLNTILHSNKGRPVQLVVVKAFLKASQNIFVPIKRILSNLQIDVNKIKNVQTNETVGVSQVSVIKNLKSGFKATYLGCVDVGNNGSVRQIEEAVKRHLAISEVVEEPVVFEIGEMCIKAVKPDTNDVMLKHSYMQISSCGSPHNRPNYVAYIAGEENCDTASRFTCYIFLVKDIEDACTILQSIGQGFYRTHFAV